MGDEKSLFKKRRFSDSDFASGSSVSSSGGMSNTGGGLTGSRLFSRGDTSDSRKEMGVQDLVDQNRQLLDDEDRKYGTPGNSQFPGGSDDIVSRGSPHSDTLGDLRRSTGIAEILFLVFMVLFLGMFAILYFSNRSDVILLIPGYVLFLSFSYMFVYLLYRADLFIRKLFRRQCEMEMSRLYRGSLIFSLLFFGGAVLYPHIQANLARDHFDHCRSNLVLLHQGMERFAEKNQGNTYPLRMDQLLPKYIKEIPTCPSTRTMSYKYMVSEDRYTYTVFCCGENHRQVVIRPGNWPQYSSSGGLLVAPGPDGKPIPLPSPDSATPSPSPSPEDPDSSDPLRRPDKYYDLREPVRK